MAVAPRRPRGPRPFERFLQLIGTGVNVASTIKGIQQRGEQLRLSEAAGERAQASVDLATTNAELNRELIEERRDTQRATDLQTAHFDGVTRRVAALFATSDEARQGAAVERLQTLSFLNEVFPGGVQNPQAPQTILLANGLAERNRMQDQTAGAEMLTKAYTLDQESHRPGAQQFFRERIAAERGIAPEDVPDDAVIAEAPGSLGQNAIHRSGLMRLLSDPDRAAQAAGLVMGQTVGAPTGVDINTFLAASEIRNSRTGETIRLLEQADTNGTAAQNLYDTLASQVGFPEVADKVIDIPPQFQNALSNGIAKRLTGLTRTEVVQANLDLLRLALSSQNTGDDEYAKLRLQSEARRANEILDDYGLTISFGEAMMVVRGDLANTEFATQVTQDVGAERVAALRWLGDQFTEGRLMATQLRMTDNAKLLGQANRTFDQVDKLGYDPTNLSGDDRERVWNALDLLNKDFEARGLEGPYLLPQKVKTGVWSSDMAWIKATRTLGTNPGEVPPPADATPKPENMAGFSQRQELEISQMSPADADRRIALLESIPTAGVSAPRAAELRAAYGIGGTRDQARNDDIPKLEDTLARLHDAQRTARQGESQELLSTVNEQIRLLQERLQTARTEQGVDPPIVGAGGELNIGQLGDVIGGGVMAVDDAVGNVVRGIATGGGRARDIRGR